MICACGTASTTVQLFYVPRAQCRCIHLPCSLVWWRCPHLRKGSCSPQWTHKGGYLHISQMFYGAVNSWTDGQQLWVFSEDLENKQKHKRRGKVLTGNPTFRNWQWTKRQFIFFTATLKCGLKKKQETGACQHISKLYIEEFKDGVISRTAAKRNCFLSIQVPFNPILFLSIDSLASCGIIHFPPGPWMAVTILSSNWTGT